VTEQLPEHVFLIRIAELLHTYGTPAHRLERVLEKVASSLGVEASFLATPTSLIASFGSGSHQDTRLLRVGTGDVNLGKLSEFDEVMEDVEHGREAPGPATARLDAIEARGARYHWSVHALATGVVSAGAACFFGGGVNELSVTFGIGIVIALLGRWLSGRHSEVGVFEPVASFLAAATAMWVARMTGAIDDRIVTLSSLIVLLPGLTLTVGMIELTTRHLVSGMARLAGAAAIFFTILLGVALAWRLWDGPVSRAVQAAGSQLWPSPLEWGALVLAPIGFAVLFEVRRREMHVVFLTGVLGYLASRYGSFELGADLGSFLGALVVGAGSNLYARLANRPALIPLTPGILLLVPGSLGYRSLTSFLDREALAGMEWAFQTGLVAVALVGGLLVGNVLVPPRRVL